MQHTDARGADARCPGCNDEITRSAWQRYARDEHGVNISAVVPPPPGEDATAAGPAPRCGGAEPDAERPCVCPGGRSFDGDAVRRTRGATLIFRLLACNSCGADFTHTECARLPPTALVWACALCAGAMTAESAVRAEPAVTRRARIAPPPHQSHARVALP
jgi:hypothetical protein